MLKTLTKQEVLDLYNALHSTGNLVGAKFAYAVARNISLLKPEVDAINAAYAPSEEFMKYDKERVALAISHAVKTPDGQPIVIDDKYELVDEAKFNAELEELKAKHAGVVDTRQKQLDEFAKFLKEEADVNLHVIEPEFMPQEISAKQAAGILHIIEEPVKN